MLVQTFISEPAARALYEEVLLGFSQLNKVDVNTVGVEAHS